MDSGAYIPEEREAIMAQLRELLDRALDEDLVDQQLTERAVAFVAFARKHELAVHQIMALHTVIRHDGPVYPDIEAKQTMHIPGVGEFDITNGQPSGLLPMAFGKHKGKALIWVVNNDPSYCRWVLANVSNNLSERARAYLIAYFGEQKPAPVPNNGVKGRFFRPSMSDQYEYSWRPTQ